METLCASQGIEARVQLARALAQQWCGVFLRPRAAADGWAVEGLVGHLEEQYVKRYMGRNELAYRCATLTVGSWDSLPCQ